MPIPEGAAVEVELHEAKPAAEPEVTEIPTLYERYKDIIGIAEGLPEDFAMNHDHYIHGTPRRKPVNPQ